MADQTRDTDKPEPIYCDHSRWREAEAENERLRAEIERLRRAIWEHDNGRDGGHCPAPLWAWDEFSDLHLERRPDMSVIPATESDDG